MSRLAAVRLAARRALLEAAVERAITALDQLDGDSDFEEQHDSEPEETDWTHPESIDQRGFAWRLER